MIPFVVLVILFMITGRGGGTGGRLGIKKRQRLPRPVSNSPKYISPPNRNPTKQIPYLSSAENDLRPPGMQFVTTTLCFWSSSWGGRTINFMWQLHAFTFGCMLHTLHRDISEQYGSKFGGERSITKIRKKIKFGADADSLNWGK